jgi:DNA-binding LacI/PurR family transcriptional regulator
LFSWDVFCRRLSFHRTSGQACDDTALEHQSQDHQWNGHRRIGAVTGIPGITTTEERLAGYKQVFAAHGIPCDPALIAVADSRVEGGERGALQLLRPEVARPTALFVMNGLMVSGALQHNHSKSKAL